MDFGGGLGVEVVGASDMLKHNLRDLGTDAERACKRGGRQEVGSGAMGSEDGFTRLRSVCLRISVSPGPCGSDSAQFSRAGVSHGGVDRLGIC